MPVDFPISRVLVDPGIQSDVDRLDEAVRRAEERYGRPVRTREVRFEIESAPELEREGRSTLSAALLDAHRHRSKHRKDGLARLPKVGGERYWTCRDESRERWWTVHASLGEEFTALEDEFIAITTIQAPEAIRRGRLATLAGQLEDIAISAKALRESATKYSSLFARLEQQVGEVHAKVRRVVGEEDACLTPGELWFWDDALPVAEALIPELIRDNGSRHPGSALARGVRTFPNRDFTNRFDTDPEKAQERLLDAVGARLVWYDQYLKDQLDAFRVSHIRLALGDLRDPAFIAVGMQSEDLNDRSICVQAAGFFGAEILSKELEEAAESDLWRIREAAAWALGFRRDIAHLGTLHELEVDSVPDVRHEAEASLKRLEALR